MDGRMDSHRNAQGEKLYAYGFSVEYIKREALPLGSRTTDRRICEVVFVNEYSRNICSYDDSTKLIMNDYTHQ